MRSGKEENLGKRACGKKMRRKSKPHDSRNQRNRQQPRKSSRARAELLLVWFGVGGAEFDGLAVGGVAVGIGPGFFASHERSQEMIRLIDTINATIQRGGSVLIPVF